ncbi:MAG: FtsQ-type POTRA domain-containing protein [Spirochaetia bacterium]
MADVLTFTSKKKQRSDGFMRKMLWGIIIILVVFSLAELFFHFFIAPRILLKNVVIQSDVALSKQEILRIAGITRKEYYFLINTAQIRNRLMAHPLVKGVNVEKIFPDTLKVTLKGRVPLLLALVNYQNKTIPAAVDEEGIIFQISDMITDWNLPVLSGLKFQNLTLGMRLPAEILPFLQELGRISRENPDLQGLISEIKVVKNGNGDFEYILYPLSYSKGVLVGRRINAGLIKYIFLALNLLQQEGILQKVHDLDFRTGELVYKMKEE